MPAEVILTVAITIMIIGAGAAIVLVTVMSSAEAGTSNSVAFMRTSVHPEILTAVTLTVALILSPTLIMTTTVFRTMAGATATGGFPRTSHTADIR